MEIASAGTVITVFAPDKTSLSATGGIPMPHRYIVYAAYPYALSTTDYKGNGTQSAP